jgi:hypothetical protein
VARYDTQVAMNGNAVASFDAAAQLGMKARGFDGAGYDGRFVYLVPSYNDIHDGGGGGAVYDGVVVRCDTWTDFATASSWSTFDLTTLQPKAAGFAGAVFDGRYLYLAPEQGTAVARFDARDAPALPPLPDFHGSFY